MKHVHTREMKVGTRQKLQNNQSIYSNNIHRVAHFREGMFYILVFIFWGEELSKMCWIVTMTEV